VRQALRDNGVCRLAREFGGAFQLAVQRLGKVNVNGLGHIACYLSLSCVELYSMRGWAESSRLQSRPYSWTVSEHGQCLSAKRAWDIPSANFVRWRMTNGLARVREFVVYSWMVSRVDNTCPRSVPETFHPRILHDDEWTRRFASWPYSWMVSERGQRLSAKRAAEPPFWACRRISHQPFAWTLPSRGMDSACEQTSVRAWTTCPRSMSMPQTSVVNPLVV